MPRATKPEWRPALAPRARLRVDRLTGRTMLIYPERGLVLNDTAAAVVKLCDGTMAVSDIVERLASEYQGPRADLAAEVEALLWQLYDRNLLRGFSDG